MDPSLKTDCPVSGNHETDQGNISVSEEKIDHSTKNVKDDKLAPDIVSNEPLTIKIMPESDEVKDKDANADVIVANEPLIIRITPEPDKEKDSDANTEDIFMNEEADKIDVDNNTKGMFSDKDTDNVYINEKDNVNLENIHMLKKSQMCVSKDNEQTSVHNKLTTVNAHQKRGNENCGSDSKRLKPSQEENCAESNNSYDYEKEEHMEIELSSGNENCGSDSKRLKPSQEENCAESNNSYDYEKEEHMEIELSSYAKNNDKNEENSKHINEEKDNAAINTSEAINVDLVEVNVKSTCTDEKEFVMNEEGVDGKTSTNEGNEKISMKEDMNNVDLTFMVDNNRNHKSRNPGLGLVTDEIRSFIMNQKDFTTGYKCMYNKNGWQKSEQMQNADPEMSHNIKRMSTKDVLMLMSENAMEFQESRDKSNEQLSDKLRYQFLQKPKMLAKKKYRHSNTSHLVDTDAALSRHMSTITDKYLQGIDDNANEFLREIYQQWLVDIPKIRCLPSGDICYKNLTPIITEYAKSAAKSCHKAMTKNSCKILSGAFCKSLSSVIKNGFNFRNRCNGERFTADDFRHGLKYHKFDKLFKDTNENDKAKYKKKANETVSLSLRDIFQAK